MPCKSTCSVRGTITYWGTKEKDPKSLFETRRLQNNPENSINSSLRQKRHVCSRHYFKFCNSNFVSFFRKKQTCIQKNIDKLITVLLNKRKDGQSTKSVVISIYAKRQLYQIGK